MGDKPEFIDLTAQLPKMEKILLVEEQKANKAESDLLRIKTAKKASPSQSSESESQDMGFELPRSTYILKVDFNKQSALNYISYFEERLAEQEAVQRPQRPPAQTEGLEVIEISDDESSASEAKDNEIKEEEYITEEAAHKLMLNQKSKNNLKYEDLVVGLMQRLAERGSVIQRLKQVKRTGTSEELSQMSEDRGVPNRLKEMIPKSQLTPITEELSESYNHPQQKAQPKQKEEQEQKKESKQPKEAYDIGDYDFDDSWIDDEEEMQLNETDEISDLQQKWLEGKLPKNFKIPKALQKYKGEQLQQYFKETEEMLKFAETPLEQRYKAQRGGGEKVRVNRDVFGKKFYQINSSDESDRDSIIIAPKPTNVEPKVTQKKKAVKRIKGSKKGDRESGSESEGNQMKLHRLQGPVVDMDRLIANYSGPVKDLIIDLQTNLKEVMKGVKDGAKKSDSPEREGGKSRRLMNQKKVIIAKIYGELYLEKARTEKEQERVIKLLSTILEKREEKTKHYLEENHLWQVKETADGKLKSLCQTVERKLRADTPPVIADLLNQQKREEFNFLVHQSASSNLKYRVFKKEHTASSKKKKEEEKKSQSEPSSQTDLERCIEFEYKKQMERWLKSCNTKELRQCLWQFLLVQYPNIPLELQEQPIIETSKIGIPPSADIIVISEEEGVTPKPAETHEEILPQEFNF